MRRVEDLGTLLVVGCRGEAVLPGFYRVFLQERPPLRGGGDAELFFSCGCPVRLDQAEMRLGDVPIADG